jgi:hypothetical protein
MYNMTYDKFKKLTRVARQSFMKYLPRNLILNQTQHQFLLDVAAHDPLDDVRQNANAILAEGQKATENLKSLNALGHESSREETLALANRKALHLFNPDKSRKYLEGTAQTLIDPSLFRSVMLLIGAWGAGLLLLILLEFHPTGLLTLFLLGLGGTYFAVNPYVQKAQYLKKGRLFMAKVVSCDIIINDSSRSTPNFCCQVGFYLQFPTGETIGFAANHPLKREYPFMGFGQDRILEELKQTSMIPIGTQIAVFYINLENYHLL